jgi:hypothetical protein
MGPADYLIFNRAGKGGTERVMGTLTTPDDFTIFEGTSEIQPAYRRRPGHIGAHCREICREAMSRLNLSRRPGGMRGVLATLSNTPAPDRYQTRPTGR